MSDAPHPPVFDAVLLAAGFSSRMQGFKPLYPAGPGSGATIIERVIDLFRRAGVRETLVVIGHEAARLAPVAQAAGARVVPNTRYGDGMFTSVQAGAAALAPGCADFFLLPVDIPAVRPETLRRLAAVFAAPGCEIVRPVFAGERGHPPLLAASLLPVILGADGQGGLRAVLDAHELQRPACVIETPVADAGVLLDMDTDADYQALLPRLLRPGLPTRAECRALLDIAATPERARAHGEAVAAVALAIGRVLNARGDYALDLDRIETASLVHDLAKGRPQHEREGARAIKEAGFHEIVELVAAHRDAGTAFLQDAGTRIGEREVVYIADKLVYGAEPVPVAERFGRVLKRHGDDPEARAAILGRLCRALTVLARFEAETDRSLFGMAVEALERV